MRRAALASLFAAAALAAAARGDTVYLRNGRVLEGTIISEDDRTVVVELAVGKVPTIEYLDRNNKCRYYDNEKGAKKMMPKRKG